MKTKTCKTCGALLIKGENNHASWCPKGGIVIITAEELNATIDSALAEYATALAAVKVSIVAGVGAESFAMLDVMHEAYKRMAGLARMTEHIV